MEYKSQVFELVSFLNKEDIKSILKLLESKDISDSTKNHIRNFFNNIEKIQTLSNEENYPYNCFQLIFLDTNFPRGKFDKLTSLLSSVIKEYILSRDYFRPENQFKREIDWLRFLRSNKLYNRYEIQLNKVKKIKSEEENLESKSNFFKEFILQEEIHEWEAIQNTQSSDINLINTIKSLEKYYLAAKYEFLNYLAIQSEVAKLNLDMETLFSSSQDENPYIYLLKECFNVYLDPKKNRDTVISLSQKIEKFENLLEKSSQSTIFAHLRNIVSFVHTRSEYALDIHYDLLKKHLEKGYLFFENQLSHTTYSNIVSIGLRLRDYEWLFYFINKFNVYISGTRNSEIYYSLSLSRYYNAIGDYEKSIEHLTFEAPEIVYQCVARRIEIKNYFELGADLIFSKMDAFKMFLSRSEKKNFQVDHRINNTHFINITNQLVSSIPGDKNRSINIIKRIIKKKFVADKEWLLEKARELGRLSDEEYEMALKSN